MALSFARRESPLVLQTKPDHQIDLSIRHVNDALNGLLGLVIPGQKREFLDQLCVDRILDESRQCLCLCRQVDVGIPPSGLVVEADLDCPVSIMGTISEK